jgi:type IV pilus assembly protein PilB
MKNWQGNLDDTQILGVLSSDMCRKFKAFPFAKDELGRLQVALLNPLDYSLISELQFVLGEFIHVFKASDEQLEEAFSKYFGNGTQMASVSKANSVIESPAIKVVESIISEAVFNGVSDIHFEPAERSLTVRFRKDGVLEVFRVVPQALMASVTSRMKILSGMDIAEKRRPQDGRIKWHLSGNRNVDIRVSSLPANYGEKLVLRLLDQDNVNLDLSKLGLSATDATLFKEYIFAPYGMILVTGPTGSGKTTTLYSALSEIRNPEINISTVEDPIEYRLEGINQMQVKSEIGLTFASALRTLLRQDPDVILVGEIRDSETAELAIRAALTGHLVLSTLHTNDAPSAIARLVDMGVENFLLSSALSLVVAQRLVRRNCKHCLVQVEVKTNIISQLSLKRNSLEWRGEGCGKCRQTGFAGRIAIYELMPVGDEIKAQIQKDPDSLALRKMSIKSGMRTLREDGLEKVLEGQTTYEEVLRETLV